MAFVTLFTISNTIFRDNWTPTVKAFFLFITFDLYQNYTYKRFQRFLPTILSIKPDLINLEFTNFTHPLAPSLISIRKGGSPLNNGQGVS